MARKATLKACPTCGQQISSNAKKCPHCGEKFKKPLYKRIWFLVLVILVGFIAIGTGTSNSSKTSSTASSNKTSPTISSSISNVTKAATAPEKELFSVGDTINVGNLELTYVSSGEYKEENPLLQPSDGMMYIFLKFAYQNTSSSSDVAISSFSFKCYADGYACDSYYGNNNDLSATLSAGRSGSGLVCFTVPKDAKEIEVEYDASLLSNKKIKFSYEGELDSGYILEANSAATQDAVSVGTSVESSNLKIDYLNCFKDTSNNSFITPKDGFHYITCEFEFENKSSSDYTISSFSFDCFADGVSCDATFFRDDNLNATLSAGRKVKGTVTFEVPNDAVVVEVEYLTNFWTSNRVVFDASVE